MLLIERKKGNAMILRTALVLSLFIATTMHANHIVEVQGHRGCRGYLPENSLIAFNSALESDVDVLEMDLAVTSDGVLVISHDPHINRELCRYNDGRAVTDDILIHRLSLAEVQSFDCGSVKHSRFPSQTPIAKTRIPTLEEVFSLVRESSHPNAKRIGFNIETKIFLDHPEYTVGPEEFSQKVVDAFRKSGFLSRITLQSFDFRTLKIAKALEPTLRTVALIEDPSIDMVAVGLELRAYAISPSFSLVNKELVRAAHTHDLKVIPWTLNTKDEWLSAIEMKVDGIITDIPQALIEWLHLL